MVAASLSVGTSPPLAAQSLDDPSRLTGISSVTVRASANWDELITSSAGGATSDQFVQALQMGLEAAMADIETGPATSPDATVVLGCHVDTYYETGLIVYSLIVRVESPGPAEAPVVTWMASSVGSYTVQQLHLIWTLADQCAATFLEDWREVNGG